MHVGVGGTRVPLVQGEHETGRTGSGLEPAELREYVPGDTAEKIDWKATARLATPHVRTYETETDRPTVLVLDQRSHLAMGPAGETKLDYLREAAMSIAASTRQLGDPLGQLTIGDEGITSRIRPTSGSGTYTTIRRQLLELEPTLSPTNAQTGQTQYGPQAATPKESSDTQRDVHRQHSHSRTNPTNALEKLGTDNSRFTDQLKPFYENQTVYSTRIRNDPFSSAVESILNDRWGNALTVLCTDDSNPTELKTIVRLLRANGNTVLVLLAPTILFESGALVDAESAYDTYLSFETLRRNIDQLDGVSAFEIGPGDRLTSVLTAGGADK
ncbi:DUF58 domain-containing protein [Halostagnicola sp. A-GB9-2]|uniref:DUF58 domain-containing protein n=1 Tax=Halostagnicola sp. A-GB9-2 TaxID=3048066 RepID=UPI0024C0C707|nr:DUF58 domain-containing protein [Halostagnicola sp. A-GB9-2]MDJ1434304.1 DUF58 domain-containing protein [Halostagnicola sp. A-GB9-2]